MQKTVPIKSYLVLIFMESINIECRRDATPSNFCFVKRWERLSCSVFHTIPRNKIAMFAWLCNFNGASVAHACPLFRHMPKTRCHYRTRSRRNRLEIARGLRVPPLKIVKSTFGQGTLFVKAIIENHWSLRHCVNQMSHLRQCWTFTKHNYIWSEAKTPLRHDDVTFKSTYFSSAQSLSAGLVFIFQVNTHCVGFHRYYIGLVFILLSLQTLLKQVSAVFKEKQPCLVNVRATSFS